MSTLRELLADLRARGRVPEGTAERIAAQLGAEQESSPWFVVALVAIGAWLATLFFVLGVGFWADGWSSWGVAGLVLIVLGLVARRLAPRLFVAQVSLGLCLAGWIALCAAGADLFEGLGGAAAVGAVAGAAIYLLHPDATMRFLVSVASLCLLSIWWAGELENLPEIGRSLPVIAMALGGGAILVRPGAAAGLLPLGRAAAFTLAAGIPFISLGWSRREVEGGWWPALIVLTLALGALVVHVLRPVEPAVRREALPLALAAVLALGLASLPGDPGLLVATSLLVLGRATARRLIEVMGLLALPWHLFLHYQDLDLPLRTKSFTLIATGAVLLASRWALSRRPWARATP